MSILFAKDNRLFHFDNYTKKNNAIASQWNVFHCDAIALYCIGIQKKRKIQDFS